MTYTLIGFVASSHRFIWIYIKMYFIFYIKLINSDIFQHFSISIHSILCCEEFSILSTATELFLYCMAKWIRSMHIICQSCYNS